MPGDQFPGTGTTDTRTPVGQLTEPLLATSGVLSTTFETLPGVIGPDSQACAIVTDVVGDGPQLGLNGRELAPERGYRSPVLAGVLADCADCPGKIADLPAGPRRIGRPAPEAHPHACGSQREAVKSAPVDQTRRSQAPRCAEGAMEGLPFSGQRDSSASCFSVAVVWAMAIRGPPQGRPRLSGALKPVQILILAAAGDLSRRAAEVVAE